jgi:hypothetical protein
VINTLTSCFPPDVSDTNFKRTLKEWNDIEKGLAASQKNAFKKRMKVISSIAEVDKFYEKFPVDTFKKQKTCRDLYGYVVESPKNITEEIKKSFKISLFSFQALGASKFPFSSKVRTLDTYGVDEHSQSFSITPEVISLLINKNAVAAYKASELLALQREWEDAKQEGNTTLIEEKRNAYDRLLIKVFTPYVPAIIPFLFKENWKKWKERTSRRLAKPNNMPARESIFDWLNGKNNPIISVDTYISDQSTKHNARYKNNK